MYNQSTVPPKWFTVSFCFVATCLVAGVVNGWPALRLQLQEDGSILDESTLGAVYTIGAFSSQGTRILVGLARDRFGTQRVACTCIFCVAVGAFGAGWSDPDNALTLSLSLFVMGLGSGTQLCVQPVAGLFPDMTGTIISTLSGAYQISGGLVFLGLTSATSNRKVAFTSYAVLLVLLSAVSAVVLPKGSSFLAKEAADEGKEPSGESKQKSDEDLDQTALNLTIGSGSHNQSSVVDLTCASEEHSEATLDVEGQKKPSIVKQTSSLEKEPTALEQLQSKEFLLLLMWFSLCMIPIQYYIGSIGFLLEGKGDDGTYSDLFSIIYAAGAMVSPVGGFLSDRFGLGFAQGLASCLEGCALLILACTDSLKVQILGKRFGFTNFGTLSGVSVFVSAVFGLLQYPLISIASGDAHSEQVVNYTLSALLFAQIPYCTWLSLQEKKE
eukprot:Nitzschia sp. Nitz4//scaffold1_size375055//74256//75638//NITZ4_000229-RA/size375055-processed-gene-0.114-mRNA-1//-1//CDS//3329540904//5000//frame0